MGFSVTSAHVIILLAVIGSAGVLGAAYANTTHAVEEGERAAARHREDLVHTVLAIGSGAAAPVHDAGAETFTVGMWNNGTVVLRVSEMEYLLDGVHATSRVTSDAVDGDASTDYWMPGQRLDVVFGTTPTAPTRFAAFSENGGSTYWRG